MTVFGRQERDRLVVRCCRKLIIDVNLSEDRMPNVHGVLCFASDCATPHVSMMHDLHSWQMLVPVGIAQKYQSGYMFS